MKTLSAVIAFLCKKGTPKWAMGARFHDGGVDNPKQSKAAPAYGTSPGGLEQFVDVTQDSMVWLQL